jgi:glucosamine-6-phosphate deaminase
MDVIEKIKPHQVFAAGDLADPWTHEVCLTVALSAADSPNHLGWLLVMAVLCWHEWILTKLTWQFIGPDEVLFKRNVILYHQSQKIGWCFKEVIQESFGLEPKTENKNTAKIHDDLDLWNMK